MGRNIKESLKNSLQMASGQTILLIQEMAPSLPNMNAGRDIRSRGFVCRGFFFGFQFVGKGSQMPGKAAVFIDGGYMDKLLYHEFQNRRIDYDKLAQEMAAPDELMRCYYYHCLPYRGNPPTQEERERYSSMHKFTKKLRFLPRFEVRLGRLAKQGEDRDGKPIFVQKRVDCMVGVDMALIAAKGKITDVALLSGDSDVIPAVEAVKHESVLVTLWHGSLWGRACPSRDLLETCDERKQITADLIERIAR